MALHKFPSGKPKPMGQCNIQAVVRDKRNQMYIFKGFSDQK
jgi:hypothetical protein